MVCNIDYDIEHFDKNTKLILDTYNQWVNFPGIKVPGQIGLINNRPVYHTTGATLKEQIKSCSKKRGSLVEFTSEDEQAQLIKIMKDTEMKEEQR